MPSSQYTPVSYLHICPFTSCKLPLPHEHLRCSNCGAIRHASFTCYWCLTQRKADLWLLKQLETIRK